MDLDVGAANSHFEHADERLSRFGSRIGRVVADVEAVAVAGHDGHCFHRSLLRTGP
jgi:hypothetical protein